MNLFELIKNNEKNISTLNLLRDKATVTLLQIKKDTLLKEHQSMTNALLILLSGKVIYEEQEKTVWLSAIHDFVKIPNQVTHKVTGVEDAVLLLVQ